MSLTLVYNFLKMWLYKKLMAVFFVLFLSFVLNTKILAAELNLPQIMINPDKYLFFSIKRLIEKATLFIKLSKESRADYYGDLTLKRTAELKYVVDNKLLGEVEHSSQRLSYQVGVLSDYLTANKIELAKNKEITIDLFNNYKITLVNLRDKYPANSSYWMLIQHSINSVDLNLEKLK